MVVAEKAGWRVMRAWLPELRLVSDSSATVREPESDFGEDQPQQQWNRGDRDASNEPTEALVLPIHPNEVGRLPEYSHEQQHGDLLFAHFWRVV